MGVIENLEARVNALAQEIAEIRASIKRRQIPGRALSVKQAAEYLGCCTRTVRERLSVTYGNHDPDLAACSYRIGTRVCFDPQKLEAFRASRMRNGTRKAAAEGEAKDGRVEGVPAGEPALGQGPRTGAEGA